MTGEKSSMQEEIPAKYRELTDKVKKYNEAYEAGEPLVTDYEYDMLMLQRYPFSCKYVITDTDCRSTGKA